MKLHEHVMVTAELLGRPLSDAAVAVMTRRLEGYPRAGVDAALERCASEIDRGGLTLAAVLCRIPGANPGAEEAWAIAHQARDEAATVVLTDSIAEALAEVQGLDDIAARMAFREAYQRLVGSRPGMPVWWPSIGHDASGRALAIEQAEAMGRLPVGTRARMGLLPPGADADVVRALPAQSGARALMPTDAEADDILREAGLDPAEVAAQGRALLAKLRGSE